MPSIYFRRARAAVVISALFAGTAAAQSGSVSPLNTLDFQQLITSAEPTAHVRLAAHFSALADQGIAEAARHRRMERTFVAPPRSQLDASMSIHCRQLAQHALQSASTLRELAAYHAQLGRGVVAELPTHSARFQAGEGSIPPSPAEVDTWLASGTTPDEHRVLADYFTTIAGRYAKTGSEHALIAGMYRGTKIDSNAVHCDLIVTAARQNEKTARAAAALQNRLAEGRMQ